MGSVFTQTFQINPMHTDCFGRARASSLLYFAQEAAGAHCYELGADWDTLNQRDLFWAVLRYRVQVTRLPSAGQTITVETWPMPTTRSVFPRATLVKDENGNELFRAIGLWVLMDKNTRTMVLPGKSGLDLPGTLRGCEPDTPASLFPGDYPNCACRRVGYTELDRNGHMNNTRYMNWVDDLLTAQYHKAHPVAEFSICYLSEARENEELALHWQLDENGILKVDAHRQRTDVQLGKDRVFSAQVTFGNSVL